MHPKKVHLVPIPGYTHLKAVDPTFARNAHSVDKCANKEAAALIVIVLSTYFGIRKVTSLPSRGISNSLISNLRQLRDSTGAPSPVKGPCRLLSLHHQTHSGQLRMYGTALCHSMSFAYHATFVHHGPTLTLNSFEVICTTA